MTHFRDVLCLGVFHFEAFFRVSMQTIFFVWFLRILLPGVNRNKFYCTSFPMMYSSHNSNIVWFGFDQTLIWFLFWRVFTSLRYLVSFTSNFGDPTIILKENESFMCWHNNHFDQRVVNFI